jgi:hypothetical protein
VTEVSSATSLPLESLRIRIKCSEDFLAAGLAVSDLGDWALTDFSLLKHSKKASQRMPNKNLEFNIKKPLRYVNRERRGELEFRSVAVRATAISTSIGINSYLFKRVCCLPLKKVRWQTNNVFF